jgi:aminoglycoside/choline kinase family phosphotransferase
VTVEGREDQIDAFLAGAGLAGVRQERLPGDASTRAYRRLHPAGGAPLILMDAPPSSESQPCPPDATPQMRAAAGYNALARLAACRVDAFAGVADYLRGRGLSAPEIVALDVPAGLAVVEDLGADLFARRTEAGEPAEPLYAAAIDLLLHLHREPPPARLPVAGGSWPLLTYDALALKTGADLFIGWWPGFAGGAAVSPEAAAEWDALWAPVRTRGEAGATVFTHRDYHAENLLWLPERAGLARVGLLDFQDAVIGHPAWDLLSLLQDARRDVAPELEAAMLDRYLAARPDLDRDAFLADYAGLAALNNSRIMGIFARLIVRDGKPRYREFLPRMRRLLTRNLAAPGMAPLKRWFDAHGALDGGA